jgi:hypothetical protein
VKEPATSSQESGAIVVEVSSTTLGSDAGQLKVGEPPGTLAGRITKAFRNDPTTDP